jgi:hypothetical protein
MNVAIDWKLKKKQYSRMQLYKEVLTADKGEYMHNEE